MWDTVPGVGECSLKSRGQLKLAQGSPGLQEGLGYLVLSLLGTQVPLGATEELRTELGPMGWI